MEGRIFNENWFYGAPDRKAHPEGRVSYTPNNLHSAAVDKLHATKNHVDVYIGTATPPNPEGYLSLSLGNVYEKDMVEVADLVILEVNENMPWTHGDTLVHISQVDLAVENNAALPMLINEEPTEIERLIGGHIADLIEDGSCLQLGIGGIPDAVLLFLHEKNDLGVHSEMFSEGVVDLYNEGVITNRNKAINRDKMVATFLMGTRRLYDFVDDNPAVNMFPVNYINDPYVIGQNDRVVAINSAIQVDLMGQVVADTLGPVQFTGIGGQVDFVRGAARSRDGKAIIALPSTAKKGAVSRIVAALDPGTAVTTMRADVDYVVTEHGIAHLRGKGLRDRAEALLAIAHPAFHDQIRDEAAAVYGPGRLSR